MREPIAIVGIGCALPGARGPQSFWRLLRDGEDAIREVPESRWSAEEFYDPDPASPRKMNTRWGGFVDDVEGFDPEFFGIAPREAARMDPQQRLALEVSWEALEDAGISASSLAGSRTAVMMGVSTYDHGAALGVLDGHLEAYDATGSALSIVANRISYVFNFQGPSLVIDSACSSSLVAIHLACQAIDRGEAALALAGGVNVVASPTIGLAFSQGGLMAPDGRCKPFDRRANGYVRSEGAGVVVLKSLSRALDDGDRVYAAILAGAVNQDGRTNGLTAPNRPAQEAVLAQVYASAGVDPAEVDYVEAHGTGTAVGDPIEVSALAAVLGKGRAPARPLRIGSVKSNVGHLEAAAGATGLIKLALSVHHGRLAPTIHFEAPNPMLQLDRLPLTVQDRLEPWPQESGRRLAGVSSFGFGGTNAHLVMAAPPAPDRERAGRVGTDPHLVPISARSAPALARRAAALERELAKHADHPGFPATVAAAAALRTDHHPYRAAVVAADGRELANGVGCLARGETAPGLCGPRTAARRPVRIAFVFPGQGSQWEGMGRRLAQTVPAFREAMHRCNAALERFLGHSLWSDQHGLTARGTAEVQPALFAFQVSLAAAWRAWGIVPDAVVGHSMGEIAAAQVSGALSLDDAAKVVCERSRLLTEISGHGGLALVELDLAEARELTQAYNGALDVAAANGPRATVLTGTPAALDAAVQALSAQGVFARRIAVDFAAHSASVEPLQPRLREALRGIDPRPTHTPQYSTVTGEPIEGTMLDPGYWERNLRQTVLFAPAVQRLLADRASVFLEVAPHPVLGRSISDGVEATSRSCAVLSSLRRDEDELRGLLTAAGELHVFGARLDWAALHPDGAAHVELPHHGWTHRRFPILSARGTRRPSRPPSALPTALGRVLGDRVAASASPRRTVWDLRLDARSAPEVEDHRVEGAAIVPGAYWLTAAAEAAAEALGNQAVSLSGVEFHRPCELSGTDDPRVQLTLQPAEDGDMRFAIDSFTATADPQTHATGELRAAADAPACPETIDAIARRCPREVADDELYTRLADAGLEYGPRFRGLRSVHVGEEEALGNVRLPEGLDRRAALHPALLDACFHTLAAVVMERAEGVLPLPASAGEVWVGHGDTPLHDGYCHVRLREFGEQRVVADIRVLDDRAATRLLAREFTVEFLAPRAARTGRLYDLRWERAEPGEPAPGSAGWLLLGGEVARALAARLEAAGDRCVVAGPPASEDPAEIDRLLDDGIEALGGKLDGVVDARGAGADPPTVAGALETVPGAAVSLAGVLAARGAGAPRLVLVTLGTQASGDRDPARLAAATLWGIGRVIGHELPELDCQLVDLESPADAAGLDAAAGAIRAAETTDHVAVRGGELRAGRLVEATRSLAAVEARPDRTYVITGGLGMLGLRLAHWLVERGARHLLLIGRGAPDATAREALADLGIRADVRVALADVSDLAQLGDALRTGELQPPIGGIIHAAGVLADATIAELDAEALHRALAGKALGAWNLHVLTREHPVELFLAVSSLAGVIGSPGQGAYAAANTFLDALALHRAAEGRPAVTVALGPVAGSGLALTSPGFERLATRGVPPLDPAVAISLIAEAAASTHRQVVAAEFDFDELAPHQLSRAARRLFAQLDEPDEESAGALWDEILALGSASERRHVMGRMLIEEASQILRVAPSELTAETPFQELGLDSLMAIELRGRLERTLDMRLSAALIYAHPTPEALTDALLERLERDEPAADDAPAHVKSPVETADDGDTLTQLDEAELAELLQAELRALEERR
jgi:acyl transferase domain-containing protein